MAVGEALFAWVFSLAAISAAPPPVVPQGPMPAQLRSGSVSDDDYPASALRAQAEGTTVVRHEIGPDGRVGQCVVARSSGNAALDSTACSLIQRRFRYRPAHNAAGNPVAEWRTNRIVWRLPAAPVAATETDATD